MAMFELPTTSETRVSPQFLFGAVSPLWGYFGAAASAGVAYWWITRWTRPANLEALFGGRAIMPDLVVDTVAADLEPVGGESAPISPMVEAVVERSAEAMPTAAPESVSEPMVTTAVETVEPAAPVTVVEADPSAQPEFEAGTESAPKVRVRKASPPTDAEA